MERTTKGICVPAIALLSLGTFALGAQSAFAQEVTPGCEAIYKAITTVPGATLYQKLGNAMTDGATLGKGLPLRQWGTIVDNTGVVCAVVTSAGPGNTQLGKQWLGSRVISAQKATTALDYSTDSLALSTGNLWAAVQPGGSLYGLQFSNPVNPQVAYGNNRACGLAGCDGKKAPLYGHLHDPMVGHYIGGNNVFGGGLPLYSPTTGKLIGALGTSGNTSCADHYISWVVRARLNLDNVPAGVADGGTDDNIIFDVSSTPSTSGIQNTYSPSGFGQALCGIDTDEPNYPSELSTNYPVGPSPLP